jgi:hypothetical protein
MTHVRGDSSLVLSIVLVLASCATAQAPDDGAGADAGSAIDAAPIDPGMSGDAAMCTLGSADHCGTCSTICPGPDDMGTLRTCSDSNSAGMCSIECKGEFYDMDGKDTNGCEGSDPVVQDTSATAVAVMLPTGNNPMNLVGTIYGDTRVHDAAPTARPLGREDWYAVTTVGVGKNGASSAMSACLGITNFPADNSFELCTSQSGIAMFDVAECVTVTGGAASACMHPDTGAQLTGPFYVRVRKLAGTNAALGYALYLEH